MRRPPWPAGAEVHSARLAGGVGAAAVARRLVAARVAGLGCREEAVLLVSELVANAVVHGGASGAGDELVVRVAVGGYACFEVCDHGPGFAAPATPVSRPGGDRLGLMLLAKLSGAWGTCTDGGACVWFTLDR